MSLNVTVFVSPYACFHAGKRAPVFGWIFSYSCLILLMTVLTAVTSTLFVCGFGV